MSTGTPRRIFGRTSLALAGAAVLAPVVGFLTIRPQRATTVSPISAGAVEEAKFIRTALEVETVRLAVERRTPEALAALTRQLSQQAEAVAAGERERFGHWYGC